MTNVVSHGPVTNLHRDCLYEIVFTATSQTSKELEHLRFTIGAGFTLFSAVPTAGTFTPGATNNWTINPGVPTATLTLILQYVAGGASVSQTFLDNIKYKFKDEAEVDLPKIDLKPDACPTCCDCCASDTAVDVPFNACEPVQTKDVMTSPCQEGLVLFVNLQVKNVCPNRAVAVLILISEVDAAGNETPTTHRVEVLAATSGTPGPCTERDCQKATFAIPGSSCTPRKFRIRTITNYLDTTPIVPCHCPARDAEPGIEE